MHRARTLITLAAFQAIALPTLVTSAVAQRGGRPPNPPKAQVASDTARHLGGVTLDFQDQELKVVLDAIAAAGDLNVSMSNIPSEHVTLHLGKPVTRDAMAELLKSVAEQHGLKVTQSAALMQIAGTPPEPADRLTPAQRLQQQLIERAMSQNQVQEMRLFTYRLKHASAVQLAPVLTSLFAGFAGTAVGGRGGQTMIPTGNGGFQIITTPAASAPNNITQIPTPFGGRGGRGNVNATTALSQALGSLSSQAGDIRIVAEESSNSLLVRATDADWALIRQVIDGVDLRPLQVLIEVTIAEVQRTHDLDVGVSGNLKRDKNNPNVTVTGPSQASAQDLIAELTGGHGTINYDIAIAALQQRGDVRVLSLPVIIAQNNRQAVLNVGSQRPFVQVSQTVPNDPTGRVQTVQYIDVGTVLTITPTINPDGYVNLQVDQQDNSASNEIQFDAPVINKREATTQIFIHDGQTTVIGGLAGNTRNRTTTGIPVLSRIPIIGPLLFGETIHNDDVSELYLFLTPHIIASDGDVDRLRDAVRDSSALLQQLNIGPHIVPKPDTVRRDSVMRRPPGEDTADGAVTALSSGATDDAVVSSRAQPRSGEVEGSGLVASGISPRAQIPRLAPLARDDRDSRLARDDRPSRRSRTIAA